MKEVMSIWSRLTGRRYSAVEAEDNEFVNPRGFRRKSSVVVNQFFGNAMPVRSDGRLQWSRSIFVLMTIGLLGLASGCLILLLQPYESIFKWKITLGEGGEIFNLWRLPPVDLYLKVYLFNVTNAYEYMEGKAEKLHLEEVGPYVYREFLEHGNITFNDNGTLTATPYHPLKYMPELSGGRENDTVIMPNIALLSIANVMKDASLISRWGLNLLIRQTDSRPLVKMTAKEFMFGYKSTLVTLGNNVMPNWIKFDRLGLIDRMYDFTGDFETVYTGETDIRKSGLIEKYKGKVDLPQWSGKCANIKDSSDGAKFPSYIQPNDTLKFFRKSLCRSASMVRVGEKEVKKMHVYKYKFEEHLLDNGAFNPDNKCFCRGGRCLPVGLIDVTECYYGFPISLSFPHFFEADPSLSKPFSGLSPNKDRHESHFYIEPKSGLPVDLGFRFQINMNLQDISRVDRVEGFSNIVLPMLWFELGIYELPDPLNNRFLLYLRYLPMLEVVGMYLLFFVGSGCLVWSVVKILLHRPNKGSGPGHWFETEMQRKRLSFLSERRNSNNKSKELEGYLNTLLTSSKDDKYQDSESGQTEEEDKNSQTDNLV